MHYKIRDGEAGDLNLILNSWLKTYKTSKFAQDIPSDIYYKYQQEKIKNLLKASDVIIAHDQEDPTHIFGYACFDPNIISNVCVLHYLYIKKPFRGLGIFTDLLAAASAMSHHHQNLPIVVTHETNQFKKAHKAFYVFNPFLKES